MLLNFFIAGCDDGSRCLGSEVAFLNHALTCGHQLPWKHGWVNPIVPPSPNAIRNT